MNKKQNEVVQFLLKFKTASEKQLIKLTNCNMQDINYLLTNKIIAKDKETGLIYHKLRGIDIKFMVALDLICKYQKDLQMYDKGKFPVIISFIVENISYAHVDPELESGKSIRRRIEESHV